MGRSSNPGNLGESEWFRGLCQGKIYDGVWAPHSSFEIVEWAMLGDKC